MSKKIIFLLTILLLASYNIEAQKITDEKFKYNIIGEDFIKKQENFPIVRETENYFIIDENEYLIIRENSESDYAIVLDESLAKNIYLNTSIKLGPSENEKSSLGIILKANKKFSEALIFEINNKGKYRIKELTNSTYKYLSNKKNRWIKHKSIKKQNLYNDVKIICENNKIIIFVNQEVLKEISYKSDETSYSGILIGPDTKARIKYFYLNTDIKQENKSKFVANTGKSLNETFNKNEVFYKLKNDFEILQYTADSINLINKELEKTINYLKQEKINFSNASSAKDLENNLAKTLKDLESKKEEIINLNEKLKALAFEKKKIKDDLLRKSEKINKLKIELKSEKSLNNSLNVKNKNNQDLISIKSKEIEELNTKNNSEKLLISSLKNKHKQRLIQLNKELELVKTENNNILEEKNKLNQKLVSTEKEKEKNTMVLLNKSALIKDLENEITKQKENNRYLKDLFVYKDFELNGINPKNSTPIHEKEKEKLKVTKSFYTIQLGVFLYPTKKYEKLETVYKSLDKNIYTYFYGKFENITDANVNLENLKQQGLKDLFIIKTEK